MRKSLLLAGIMLLAIASSSYAMKPNINNSVENDWNEFLRYELGDGAAGFADTVRFGGDGFGNVIRGSDWDWETRNPAVPAQTFPFGGGNQGNQYSDGWTFEDRTSRGGPSQTGAGHWGSDGTYDFDDDTGGFAHRATTHANDGVDDGPDPITVNGGSWSVWIGTNLLLNPEHCGWEQTAGHGNGWSQGIKKQFPSVAFPQITMSFFHRYAVEAGFDTNWIEVSSDGVFWDQIGDAENTQGIYNDGDKDNPLPLGGDGQETVIINHPSPGDDLWIRFRFASDAFFSDESEGGVLFHGWVIDDISIAQLGEATDFEAGMNGWQPSRFEGFDFNVTLSQDLAAGRIVNLDAPGINIDQLNCPLVLPCPEACSVESNILAFTDPNDCDLSDDFQDSYATSPAFSIGGPENPDIDGVAGRIVFYDVYRDGGAGDFNTGYSICWVYSPFNANNCPYTPPGGDPGAGLTFNWSRTGFNTCDFYSMGTETSCLTQAIDDVSAFLPADADSVIIHFGVFSQCRSDDQCVTADNGAPFIDNLSFGVFNPEGVSIQSRTLDRYADSYPMQGQAHAGLDPLTVRTDGNHSFTGNLGLELPLRWVRADTSSVKTAAPNAAAYLRFRVRPGPCQEFDSAGQSAFFAEYPPNSWHEARMDTSGAQGTGTTVIGDYMTCYHEADPLNGTSWGGELTPVEPCDDILPDGVFNAGTEIDYFYEVRDATSGQTIGTSPAGVAFAPIDTTGGYSFLWRIIRNLPELKAPPEGNCNPVVAGDRANSVLVFHDTESNVHRGRIRALLDSFNVEYDFYQHGATNFTGMYNGIGRREDRNGNQPRPSVAGATEAQIDPYRCIWYSANTTGSGTTLSDILTSSFFGGQPSIDQQALEGWLAACQSGDNRLLVLDGYGWASEIDINTTNGPAFLTNRGVDVIDVDYEDLTGDLRRCARITGTAVAPTYDAEVFGTGCPDDLAADVYAAVAGGTVVANYVDGNSTPECGDDVDLGVVNANAIRNSAGPGSCARTVAFSASVVRTHDLKCSDSCLFEDWTLGGAVAQLVSDMFAWAGKPIGPPIAVNDVGAPTLATQLIGARPNPANPSAKITFSLAQKGAVKLRVFDVSGRMVRTLVDEVLEPSNEAFEFVWDGKNENGQHVGSGVFFYQLDAPNYTSAKKLVILK